MQPRMSRYSMGVCPNSGEFLRTDVTRYELSGSSYEVSTSEVRWTSTSSFLGWMKCQLEAIQNTPSVCRRRESNTHDLPVERGDQGNSQRRNSYDRVNLQQHHYLGNQHPRPSGYHFRSCVEVNFSKGKHDFLDSSQLTTGYSQKPRLFKRQVR